MRKKTHQQLAEQYQVSRQSISRWSRDGVNIHSAPAMRKKIASMTNRLESSHDIASARLEKLQAETARIKHAYEVDRGLFVSAANQLAAGQMAGQTIRETITKMTADLPPMLAGRTAAEIHIILKKYTREQLVALSKYDSPLLQQLKP